MGGIFEYDGEPLKFYLTRFPSRSSVSKAISDNGGEVSRKWTSDLITLASKEALEGVELQYTKRCFSFKYVDDCIAEKALLPLEQYAIHTAPPAASTRSATPTSAATPAASSSASPPASEPAAPVAASPPPPRASSAAAEDEDAPQPRTRRRRGASRAVEETPEEEEEQEEEEEEETPPPPPPKQTKKKTASKRKRAASPKSHRSDPAPSSSSSRPQRVPSPAKAPASSEPPSVPLRPLRNVSAPLSSEIDALFGGAPAPVAEHGKETRHAANVIAALERDARVPHAVAVHALYAFSGNAQMAYEHLSGRGSDLSNYMWDTRQDEVLVSDDPAAINRVKMQRGAARIAERLWFLEH